MLGDAVRRVYPGALTSVTLFPDGVLRIDVIWDGYLRYAPEERDRHCLEALAAVGVPEDTLERVTTLCLVTRGEARDDTWPLVDRRAIAAHMEA